MKFENIGGAQLDLKEKYVRVLAQYARDLESVKKLYQRQKVKYDTTYIADET